MQLNRRDGLTVWFGKSAVGSGKSKSFSIFFYPQHWKTFGANHNGAVKGKDMCLDVSFWALGFCFNYTNWEYNK